MRLCRIGKACELIDSARNLRLMCEFPGFAACLGLIVDNVNISRKRHLEYQSSQVHIPGSQWILAASPRVSRVRVTLAPVVRRKACQPQSMWERSR